MSPHASRKIHSSSRAGLLAVVVLASACGHEVADAGPSTGTSGPGTTATAGATDNDASSGGDSSTGDPAAACQLPALGPAVVRRLTRVEYNNTVRDLLGDTSRPADAFPAEEVVNGFNNNAAALGVTDLLAEQYMSAAEALSAAAVQDIAALLPCDPVVTGEVACGQAFIAAFGRRAYRRPLAVDERARLESVFSWGLQDGGFTSGIALTLQAILQSPSFLYRVEVAKPDPALPPGVRRLTSWELASRLSFFAWNSTPDDPLLDLAASGDLVDPEVLRAEAVHLLADPRARSPVLDFHAQLLDLAALSSAARDPETFPDLSDEIRGHMLTETDRFVEHVFFADDARWSTLLTAPYTFLNTPLAEYYGLIGVAGPEFGKVDLPANSHRAGLLTQGSLLAVLGKFASTAPIQRGRFVRQQLLCQVILPPPDVEFMPPDIDPNATTREKYKEHSINPACAGCHVLMDPIGFGFEHFDGAGRYRAVENGFPIDAAGEIVGGDASLAGPFDGVAELSARLSDSPAVYQCLVRQHFRYAFGREPTVDDQCTLDSLAAVLDDSDGDLRALRLAMITSDAFRYLATEAP